MAKRYYVDTSAYLCVLLGEKGAEALSRELEGGELLVSSLLLLEAHRNLVRLSRQGMLSAVRLQDASDRLDADVRMFVVRDLTLDICQQRDMPIISTPRSLDLAHLRTALWFHRRQPIHRFVSTDVAQKLAAREFGLPV